MIRRLTAFTVAAGAAIAALAVASQPASASTPSSGAGWGVGCFAVDASGMNSECAEINVTGSVSAGMGHATATFAPQTDSRVLRTQIDYVGLELGGSGSGVAGASRPVTGGQPGHPLNASSSVALYVPQFPPCGQRYRVYLAYSARFADGSLHQGRFRGPWFDSADGPCASGTSLTAKQITHCMVHFPDGSLGDCMLQRVDLLVSNDGHTLYGLGKLVVDGGSDQIARVQVDQVSLTTQYGVIAASQKAVNSGTRIEPYDAANLSAESETGSARWRACGQHYTVTMYYSVRYTNGTLYHGTWATNAFTHC